MLVIWKHKNISCARNRRFHFPLNDSFSYCTLHNLALFFPENPGAPNCNYFFPTNHVLKVVSNVDDSFFRIDFSSIFGILSFFYHVVTILIIVSIVFFFNHKKYLRSQLHRFFCFASVAAEALNQVFHVASNKLTHETTIGGLLPSCRLHSKKPHLNSCCPFHDFVFTFYLPSHVMLT